MNQKQWAIILGVSPQFVSQWKLGKVGISVETALKWSKIFGMGIENLLTLSPKGKAALLKRRVPNAGHIRNPDERPFGPQK